MFIVTHPFLTTLTFAHHPPHQYLGTGADPAFIQSFWRIQYHAFAALGQLPSSVSVHCTFTDLVSCSITAQLTIHHGIARNPVDPVCGSEFYVC